MTITIDSQIENEIKTIMSTTPYVFDIRDIDGIVTLSLTSQDFWTQNGCMDDSETEEELSQSLETMGFYECMEHVFDTDRYSVSQIPDLIDLFKDIGFVYDQTFINFLGSSYKYPPPPQQNQPANQGCCGNCSCGKNQPTNQPNGFTIQQVAQSMQIQLEDDESINDGSIRFLKDGWLGDLEESEKDKTIDSFTGEYEFLSNGYCVEQKSSVYYEDKDEETNYVTIEPSIKVFPSLEHAYQASKTLSATDQEEIRTALTVGQAKRLGKFVDQTSNFETNKLTIMERLVEDKFACNLRLKVKLLMTGTADLVQKGGIGPKYQFWGVDDTGIGENHMGKILMKVRNRIIREEGDWKSLVRAYLEKEGLGFVIEKLSCGQN